MKTPKKIKLLLKYLRSQLPSCYSVLSHFSRIQFFVTPWTVDHRAPLAMGFSRQEYWSGLPCPPAGDLPNPGMEPPSLMSPVLAGGFFTISATWSPYRDSNKEEKRSLFWGGTWKCRTGMSTGDGGQSLEGLGVLPASKMGWRHHFPLAGLVHVLGSVPLLLGASESWQMGNLSHFILSASLRKKKKK